MQRGKGQGVYDPQGLDMIYPLGVASKYPGSKELQISIGTFRRHVSGIRRMIVVGLEPEFVLPEYTTWIPFEQSRAWPKEYAIARVLSEGMKHADTETVVIQGDDHLATQPFDIRDMRAPAGPSLRAVADKNPNRLYSKYLRQTSKYLRAQGSTEIHFDRHMPMHVKVSDWLGLETHWEASRKIAGGYTQKSLYGNLCKVEPQYGPDYKANKDSITIEDLFVACRDRQVISFGDKCAKLIFELFSEYLV